MPPVGVVFAAAQTNQYEVSWALSEDDGSNDRDVDHYEVFSWILPGESGVQVADIAAGQSVYIDDPGQPPPQVLVMYEVSAVDAGGLASERVGLPISADIDGDGVADLEDVTVFVNVLLGLDVDPDHVAASDVNLCGAADGLDVQPFVGLLVP